MLSEKAMAPHSSTLAWKIPWMEEPGGLQSMGCVWRGGVRGFRAAQQWVQELRSWTWGFPGDRVGQELERWWPGCPPWVSGSW